MRVRILIGALCLVAGAHIGAVQAAPRVGHGALAQPKLVAQQVGHFRDSLGALWFFGEVVNRGPGSASAVAVEVGVYNNRNQRLARGVTLSISSNVLKPGSKGVWLTDMTDNPKTWHRVAITIGQTISADEMRASNYTGIRVDKAVMGPENPGYSDKVTGTVTNVGGKRARVDEIMVALYNSRGKLTRVAGQGILYPYSSSQLIPAGKKAPYMISVLGVTHRAPRVVVYVRASKK